MQGSISNKKRKNPEQADYKAQKEDVDMNGSQDDTTSIDSSQRKIVKAKKKLQNKESQPAIIEDEGEVIELGSEQEYEDEDVI
jgi:hypothetical protein